MAKEKDEAVATDEGKAAEETTKESKIAAKPEGFVSPYAYAALLSKRIKRDIRPQTIYSNVRNQPKLKDGTPFPVEQNTDGHYMVPVKAADDWFDKRQVERAAAKTAKAEKDTKDEGDGDEAAAE